MIQRFDQLIAKPWPNGRGVTRDVAGATYPTGKIQWLISVAELVEDAEFSHFDGCNRIFTLIGNSSVDLHINNTPPIRCRPLQPVCFPGDQPTRCSMVGGQTRAFNVFLNRSDVRAAVYSFSVAKDHEVMLPRPPAAVHCVSGAAQMQGELLTYGDTMIRPPTSVIRACEAPAVFLAVELLVEPRLSDVP